jgi:hypothetical protein
MENKIKIMVETLKLLVVVAFQEDLEVDHLEDQVALEHHHLMDQDQVMEDHSNIQAVVSDHIEVVDIMVTTCIQYPIIQEEQMVLIV